MIDFLRTWKGLASFPVTDSDNPSFVDSMDMYIQVEEMNEPKQAVLTISTSNYYPSIVYEEVFSHNNFDIIKERINDYVERGFHWDYDADDWSLRDLETGISVERIAT